MYLIRVRGRFGPRFVVDHIFPPKDLVRHILLVIVLSIIRPLVFLFLVGLILSSRHFARRNSPKAVALSPRPGLERRGLFQTAQYHFSCGQDILQAVVHFAHTKRRFLTDLQAEQLAAYILQPETPVPRLSCPAEHGF